MKILVIGEPVHLEECQMKFGNNHTYSWVKDHSTAEKSPETSDIIFDFIIDEEQWGMEVFRDTPASVFFNTCKISLSDLTRSINNGVTFTMFGFNGMPTLLNRKILEVSLWQNKDLAKLQQACENLNTEFLVVDDRVGLVTPRVICMIINEAYYTVQERTASREDIDSAMKLGTNYPYGPFEWCHRIGIRHVYELLEATYNDTKDERYKICPLLKKEYLASDSIR
jgi:3-hydroxybutyryl-CoA dehydrogenase